MSLGGRIALVTGASRGLGRAIAERLATDGATVVMTGRNVEPLRAAHAEIQAGLCPPDPARVVWEAGDVSAPADAARMVARAEREFGRLDVLVCNAGIYGPIGPVEAVDWSEWARAIEINLLGTVLCCRAAIPIMRRQRGGKIILLSGGGATQPLPRLSAYAAAKAAVVRFGETLAKELEDDHIDVNAIAPGALNTRLLDEVLAAGPERAGHAFHARAEKQRDDGGTPLSVGTDLVAFLASARSDGITGRLLAAVWDDWRSLPARRERLAESDVYTLRRIVPSDRGWPEE